MLPSYAGESTKQGNLRKCPRSSDQKCREGSLGTQASLGKTKEWRILCQLSSDSRSERSRTPSQHMNSPPRPPYPRRACSTDSSKNTGLLQSFHHFANMGRLCQEFSLLRQDPVPHWTTLSRGLFQAYEEILRKCNEGSWWKIHCRNRYTSLKVMGLGSREGLHLILWPWYRLQNWDGSLMIGR